MPYIQEVAERQCQIASRELDMLIELHIGIKFTNHQLIPGLTEVAKHIEATIEMSRFNLENCKKAIINKTKQKENQYIVLQDLRALIQQRISEAFKIIDNEIKRISTLNKVTAEFTIKKILSDFENEFSDINPKIRYIKDYLKVLDKDSSQKNIRKNFTEILTQAKSKKVAAKDFNATLFNFFLKSQKTISADEAKNFIKQLEKDMNTFIAFMRIITNYHVSILEKFYNKIKITPEQLIDISRGEVLGTLANNRFGTSIPQALTQTQREELIETAKRYVPNDSYSTYSLRQFIEADYSLKKFAENNISLFGTVSSGDEIILSKLHDICSHVFSFIFPEYNRNAMSLLLLENQRKEFSTHPNKEDQLLDATIAINTLNTEQEKLLAKVKLQADEAEKLLQQFSPKFDKSHLIQHLTHYYPEEIDDMKIGLQLLNLSSQTFLQERLDRKK